MSTITYWLDRFWNALEGLDRARQEAWLAKSTDVYELEERIRDLERHAARGAW